MRIVFQPPTALAVDALHHQAAASGNTAAASAALDALADVLSGNATHDKILLRAAAGAGKSFVLRRMVKEALAHPDCERVGVTAFANKQIWPLARELGIELGADQVCLFVSQAKLPEVPADVLSEVRVATKANQIPTGCSVIVATSHKFGVPREEQRLLDQLDFARNDTHLFDVLLVDEAWQLPLVRFSPVERLAPIVIGVGDVGQLPPIDPGTNPWRGDPGYNPYRAWPTAFEGKETTVSIDLPAVWRPTGDQLPLWRAFYSDWDALHCVAAPGDRGIELPHLQGPEAQVWAAVASGVPTLLEIGGLEDAEAPDIDRPLLAAVEDLLCPLLEQGFTIVERRYDALGQPLDEARMNSGAPSGDPLIVILATRNQAVDDAQDLVERLTEKYSLPAGVLIASTVDSWQGQTNRITIAIHPLSGAGQLDEFNSAFGRLAVTCTRATHGLLMVARAGLDDLLDKAAARPGTPFGEPGPRSLPRQTHQRILDAFSRGMWIREESNHS